MTQDWKSIYNEACAAGWHSRADELRRQADICDAMAQKPPCPNCGSVYGPIGEAQPDGSRRWACPCGTQFVTNLPEPEARKVPPEPLKILDFSEQSEAPFGYCRDVEGHVEAVAATRVDGLCDGCRL